MKAGTITNWQPSSYDEHTIEREFKQVCRDYGLNVCGGNFEIRSPHTHREVFDFDMATDWHRDVHGPFQEVHSDYIVMWSNIMPTQIKDEFGRRYDGAPGDVVVVDNSKVQHRAPKGVCRANRWFVRAHIHK